MADKDTEYTTPVAAAGLPGADVERADVGGGRRWDYGMLLATGWLGLVVLLALFADFLPLRDISEIDVFAKRQGPSAAHWLGADQLGRDILARVVYGGRTSLLVGVGATVLAGAVGMLIGLFAGYFKRSVETISMGAMDILLSFPALVLAIALTAVIGQGTGNIIIAIAILALPAFARIARAQALSYSERTFVTAARSVGAGHLRIMVREIGANILPTVAAYAFVIIAVAIVVEGSLSFLGIGVPVDVPSWGGMIAYGRPELERAAHIAFFPAAAMFLTVLSLNALGEKLRHGATLPVRRRK